MTATPTDRPLGYVLIGKDNAPALPTLYGSLAAACDAETRYRDATGRRALPTPVYTRNAIQRHLDTLTESGT